MLSPVNVPPRLLVPFTSIQSCLITRGNIHGSQFHASTRRSQKAVKETATTKAKTSSKPTLSKKTSLLTRSVTTKKNVPIRPVTTLSTSSPSPVNGSGVATVDPSKGAITSPLLYRGSITIDSFISFKEQGGIAPNARNRPNEVKEFKSRSSTTQQLSALRFPPPTSALSDPPDSLPFLDFRTNDSREVYYTKCDKEADLWLESLESQETRMWALDAEWKPYDFILRAQGRIALIQLGNDKTVYLFHVIHMNRFPSVLARILEDKHVLKVGVNIRNDGTKIKRDWGVGCASLVELGVISLQVQDNLEKQRKVRSMDKLSRELLGHAVEKVAITRMGDWQRKHLSPSQLAYAANDVFITYEVADRLKQLQRVRPGRDYSVELITILDDGAEIKTVRGSLQEREDDIVKVNDTLEKTRRVGRPPAIKIVDTSRRSTIAKAEPSHKLTKGKTVRPNRVLAKKWIFRPTSTITTFGPKVTPRTAATRVITKPQALLGEEPQFPYWINPETESASQLGGKSVVTVIRMRQQKRTFVTSRSLLKGIFMTAENDSDDKLEDNSDKGSGVYVPSSILPESLEGKSILERNQAVWLEAGGQDFSEEIDGQRVDSDEDWHLRRNQALFQSLMPGSLLSESTREDDQG
ncbi:hypothetical protein BGZ46_009537 [Entomortierella lignicola]|nr:hypothetical protein BGZ46_009537 [Entomortierella lignicola]